MARVDAGNDDLLRYVVRRYAYDPQRRERRHQIVAAFDNEREWGAFLDQAAAQLGQDRAAAWSLIPAITAPGWCWSPATSGGSRTGG